VRLASLFYGGMAALALLWRGPLVAGPVFFASDQAAAEGVRWGPDLGAGLVSAVAVIVLSRELTRRTRFGDVLARSLAHAIGPLTRVQIALLALLSGCAEELLFRGALQPHLGLLPTSLVFGLAHFVPRRELAPWALFSVAAGLLLGGLFEWTGNLLAPIAAHIGINAVNLDRLVAEYGSGSRAPSGEEEPQPR
jgi:membrane protease YdiL (CAAX protease family)